VPRLFWLLQWARVVQYLWGSCFVTCEGGHHFIFPLPRSISCPRCCGVAWRLTVAPWLCFLFSSCACFPLSGSCGPALSSCGAPAAPAPQYSDVLAWMWDEAGTSLSAAFWRTFVNRAAVPWCVDALSAFPLFQYSVRSASVLNAMPCMLAAVGLVRCPFFRACVSLLNALSSVSCVCVVCVVCDCVPGCMPAC
jgi:hypothetical protein